MSLFLLPSLGWAETASAVPLHGQLKGSEPDWAFKDGNVTPGPCLYRPAGSLLPAIRTLLTSI